MVSLPSVAWLSAFSHQRLARQMVSQLPPKNVILG
jgi:hypothetical protein